MPPSQTPTLSAPFAHREFNGEQLLDELRDLRGAGVGQRHLVDCVLALREVTGLPVPQAVERIREIATYRFQAQPELAGSLVRWAAKLRTGPDVEELVEHFHRLAASALLIGAMGRGVSRLPGGLR